MKVYCIIVTYNGSKWVEKCLGSLSTSLIPLNIIAIDNASSDNTVELIKENFPTVEITETGSNLGFGQANNIGLKMALSKNADYVFLLNQDAWIESSTIARLIEIHQENSTFGIISPMHINGNNEGLEYKFKEYIQLPFSDGMVSDYYMNKVKPLYETQFVNAAAWLISKDCLQTVGGFDPLYPHYGEDVDYVQRAQYFKFKTGICTSARIWHDSKFKTWKEILWNRKVMTIIYLSEVKSINGSLRSNTLVFLKKRFDDITAHFLYGRFKLFFYQISLTWGILIQLSNVSKSRKISKIEGAYL